MPGARVLFVDTVGATERLVGRPLDDGVRQATVEQEAAKKFVDRERHDLHAVPVGVVAPAKADAAVDDGEPPVVGESTAVPGSVVILFLHVGLPKVAL